MVVAGGRSRVGTARQRGRNLVAVRRPETKQRPVAGPLSCGFLARREGFEPPTARSVVMAHPSPRVLPIPSRPCFSWSTPMSVIRVGHPSPPVACGLVAMCSIPRPAVCRPSRASSATSRASGTTWNASATPTSSALNRRWSAPTTTPQVARTDASSGEGRLVAHHFVLYVGYADGRGVALGVRAG